MVVFSLIIIDVYHVDLVELAPLYAFAVQVGNAVGWQVGHLDAYLVAAWLQGLRGSRGYREQTRRTR